MSEYPKDIIKHVEDLRNRTSDNIADLQKGLIPEFVDLKWSKIDKYNYNGKIITNILNEDLTYFKVSDIRYTQSAGTKSNARFSENAYDAVVTKKLVNPFALFINGLFISLKKITLVRELKYSYLVITDTAKFGEIKDMQMIHIPFKCYYSEDREYEDKTVVFQFNELGLTAPHGHIVYATDIDTMIVEEDSFLTGATVNKMVLSHLKPTFKLTANNFIFFKDRKLITDMPVEMHNLNIVTFNNGEPFDGDIEYRLYYRDVVNENISNVTVPDNVDYLKGIITEQIDPGDLDITTLEQDFNFKYDKNITYDENLNHAIQYLHMYRQFLVNPIYENRSIIRTLQYTGKEIKEKLDSKGNLHMLRWKYKALDTFVMVFRNNELYERYLEIEYEANRFTLPAVKDVVEDNDIWEIVFFRFINNFTTEYTMPVDENWITHIPLRLEELQIASPWIPDQYYSLEPAARTRYPIDFIAERDEEDPSIIHIHFKDNAYYEVPEDMPDRTQYKLTIYTDGHSDIYINGDLITEDYALLRKESAVELNIIPHDGYFMDGVELNGTKIPVTYEFVILNHSTLEVRTDTLVKDLALVIPEHGKITVNGAEYTKSATIQIATDSTVNAEFGSTHWDYYVSKAYLDGIDINPNSYSFIMDQQHTLQIEMLQSIETFSVTVDASTHCDVSLNNSIVTTGNYPYMENTLIEIRVNPHPYYVIESVTLDGEDISDELPYTLKVIHNHELVVKTRSTLYLDYHLDPMMRLVINSSGQRIVLESEDDPVDSSIEIDYNTTVTIVSASARVPTYAVRQLLFDDTNDILDELPYDFVVDSTRHSIYLKGAALIALIANYEPDEVYPTVNGQWVPHEYSNYFNEFTKVTIDAYPLGEYVIERVELSENSGPYKDITLPYTFTLTSASVWNIYTKADDKAFTLNYYGAVGDEDKIAVLLDNTVIMPNSVNKVYATTAQYEVTVKPKKGYKLVSVTLDNLETNVDLATYTTGIYTITVPNTSNHNLSVKYETEEWFTFTYNIFDCILVDYSYGNEYNIIAQVSYLKGVTVQLDAKNVPAGKRAVIYENNNASQYVSLPMSYVVDQDRNFTIKPIELGTDYMYQVAYCIGEEPHYDEVKVSLTTMGVTNICAPSTDDNPSYAIGLSTSPTTMLTIESTNPERYIEYIKLNNELTFYSSSPRDSVVLDIPAGTYIVKVGLYNPRDCRFLYNIQGVSVYINDMLFTPGMYTLYHTSDDAPIQYRAYGNGVAYISITDPNEKNPEDPNAPWEYSGTLPYAFNDVTDWTDVDDMHPMQDVNVLITSEEPQPATYTLTYSNASQLPEGYTVTVDGKTLNCGESMEFEIDTVASYIITVTAKENYQLLTVKIDDTIYNVESELDNFQFNVMNNKDHTLIITAKEKTIYYCTYSNESTGTEGVSFVIDNEEYPVGSRIPFVFGEDINIFIDITAKDGYRIASIYVDGQLAGSVSDQSHRVALVNDEDHVIIVNAEQETGPVSHYFFYNVDGTTAGHLNCLVNNGGIVSNQRVEIPPTVTSYPVRVMPLFGYALNTVIINGTVYDITFDKYPTGVFDITLTNDKDYTLTIPRLPTVSWVNIHYTVNNCTLVSDNFGLRYGEGVYNVAYQTNTRFTLSADRVPTGKVATITNDKTGEKLYLPQIIFADSDKRYTIDVEDDPSLMSTISVVDTDDTQVQIVINDTYVLHNNDSMSLPTGSQVKIFAQAIDPSMQQYAVLDVTPTNSGYSILSAKIAPKNVVLKNITDTITGNTRNLNGKCGIYIANNDTNRALSNAFIVNGELLEDDTEFDVGTEVTLDIADEVREYLKLFMWKTNKIDLPYTFTIKDDMIFAATFDIDKPIDIDLYNLLTGYDIRVQDTDDTATLTFIPEDDSTIRLDGEPVIGPTDVIRDALYHIDAQRNDTSEYIKLQIELTPRYDEYLGKLIGLYSKYQFRYYGLKVQENQCIFRLTDDFIYALDPNNYMVFVNGRMLTDNMFRVLIETKDNAFIEPSIHTRVMCKPGDRFDAFYLPFSCVPMDISDAHKTTISSVTATDDKQPMFTIPFPFDSYFDNAKNSFIVIYGSVILDPQRYNVIGNKLVLLDENDYIDKGRDLTFIFFYSEASSLDNLNFVDEEDHIIIDSSYILADEDGQQAFTIPWPNDTRFIRGVHPMFVTIRSLYVNPSRYTINTSNNTLTFTDSRYAETIMTGTAVVFTFMYPQIDREIQSTIQHAVATSNGQIDFAMNLPYENYLKDYNNCLVTLEGTFLKEKSDYTIDSDTNRLSFNDYRGLNTGEELLITYCYGVNLTIRSMALDIEVTEQDQTRFKLPEVFDGYTNPKNKFFLVVNSVYIDPRRYQIIDNYIVITDETISYPIGVKLTLYIIYTQDTTYIPASNLDASASNRYTTIESIAVPIEYNGQKTFTIPKENALILNKQFFVNIGSTFIHDVLYTKNPLDNTITFSDEMTEGLDAGREVLFSFIDNDYLVIERETSETYAEADGQLEFNIELPFTNYLALGNQVLVFKNRTFMDPSRYTINSSTGTITLLDMDDALDKGEALFFMFIYVANQQNTAYDRDDVSSAKIQEYGYIYLTKNNLKYAMAKKLYFLFINGKKIDLNSIKDIAANLIRLTRDVQTRYNVAVIDYTPQIPEFEIFSRILSEYDQVMNKVKYEQLNTLFNTYVKISDTEPWLLPDISQESMIKDIVLYYYVAHGISEGLPFVYTYNHGALTVKDEYGNFIIDSLDGNTENKTNIDHHIND